CRSLVRARPPRPTLFPYTTLFRSGRDDAGEPAVADVGGERVGAGPHEVGDVVDLVEGALPEIGALRREHRIADPGPVQEGLVGRSEEHTSELQSLTNLVCRLLLEK